MNTPRAAEQKEYTIKQLNLVKTLKKAIAKYRSIMNTMTYHELQKYHNGEDNMFAKAGIQLDADIVQISGKSLHELVCTDLLNNILTPHTNEYKTYTAFHEEIPHIFNAKDISPETKKSLIEKSDQERKEYLASLHRTIRRKLQDTPKDLFYHFLIGSTPYSHKEVMAKSPTEKLQQKIVLTTNDVAKALAQQVDALNKQ